MLVTAPKDFTVVSHSHIQNATQKKAIPPELEEAFNSIYENVLSVYF